jgi:hypothetical protein
MTIALAQRELLLISKKINMQNLLSEFEEKVCEIVTDTIYQTIESACENSVSKQNLAFNSSYLQNANHILKKILKVFNYNDSCGFIRYYQRYLIPYLTHRATKHDNANNKTITKSIEFLSRKLNSTTTKLIEDNFPFIFTFTTLNSNGIGKYFLLNFFFPQIRKIKLIL